MTWPIVCDTEPKNEGVDNCPYCGVKTRHPCNSTNAKWCNHYAPGAIAAFGLLLRDIQRQKNTQT